MLLVNMKPMTFGVITETYSHSSTPYGKDLTGDGLRKDLNHVFDTLVSNAEKMLLVPPPKKLNHSTICLHQKCIDAAIIQLLEV